MGLFSKTKTYVETTTLPMVEDTPNLAKQSILNSIYKDRSVSDDMISNMMGCLGSRAERYYRYGRDKFYYGLPEGAYEFQHASSNTVKLVIDNELDIDSTISYSIFSVAHSDYYAHEFLQNTRGWDFQTNEVSNPHYTTTGTVTFETTEWISSNSIKIFYKDTSATSLRSETITLDSTVNRNDKYYHVAYFATPEDVTNGIRSWWFYNPDEGTYITLDVDAEDEGVVPYFPIIPLRRDNVDLTENKNTELYKTSRDALKVLDMDIDELAVGLNENPDIDEVDNAYIIMGVHLQSENKYTKAYLHDYFLYLSNQDRVNKADHTAWLNKSGSFRNRTTPPINKVVVKETENNSGEKGSYHIEMGWLYTETEIRAGIIGDVGTAIVDTVIKPRKEYDTYAYEDSYVVFKKQVTENTYSEVRVVGLKHVNYVYGNKSIDTTLEDSLSEDNDDFIIPLHRSVIAHLSPFDKSDLMYDAVRLTINSVVTKKLKWYQTGFFKFVIAVVAVIITIYTGIDSISTMAAITGSTNVILNFAVYLTLMLAFQRVINLVVNVLGEKFAFISAVVLTVYGLAGGSELFSATAALQLQSGILSGIDHNLSNELNDIMNEFDALQAEMEREQAEMDELMEAFPQKFTNPLTALDLGGSLATPFETPDMYYNTRIHSGNIGVMAFDALTNYVDNNLKLKGVSDRNALDIL